MHEGSSEGHDFSEPFCVFSVSTGHSGFRPTLKGNSPHLVVAFVLAEATSLYITSAACLIVALPAAEGCAWLCSLLLMSCFFPRCHANLCEGIRKCSCLMAFYRGPRGPREGNLRWKMSWYHLPSAVIRQPKELQAAFAAGQLQPKSSVYVKAVNEWHLGWCDSVVDG